MATIQDVLKAAEAFGEVRRSAERLHALSDSSIARAAQEAKVQSEQWERVVEEARLHNETAMQRAVDDARRFEEAFKLNQLNDSLRRLGEIVSTQIPGDELRRLAESMRPFNDSIRQFGEAFGSIAAFDQQLKRLFREDREWQRVIREIRERNEVFSASIARVAEAFPLRRLSGLNVPMPLAAAVASAGGFQVDWGALDEAETDDARTEILENALTGLVEWIRSGELLTWRGARSILSVVADLIAVYMLLVLMSDKPATPAPNIKEWRARIEEAIAEKLVSRGYVVTTGLHLRSEPDSTSKSLMVLIPGSYVEEIRQSGHWSEVIFSEYANTGTIRRGWVYRPRLMPVPLLE